MQPRPGAHRAPGDPLNRRRAARPPQGPAAPEHSRGDEEAPDLGALVAAARAGDDRAFEVLVTATYGGVYAVARRLTGHDEDARDVVQETVLRAHRGLRRFRGDAAVTTWLHRIAANRALTLLERRQRRPVVSLEAEATRDHLGQVATAAHGAASDRADLREDLSAALAELPPKLRAVVVLRDVEDLPHAEIAALLGISETAAKVRLHRARRQLRDRLYGRVATASDAGAGARARGERRSGSARAL